MGGLLRGAAGGIWVSGDEAPSRQRHMLLETEPPALENIVFFWKKKT